MTEIPEALKKEIQQQALPTNPAGPVVFEHYTVDGGGKLVPQQVEPTAAESAKAEKMRNVCIIMAGMLAKGVASPDAVGAAMNAYKELESQLLKLSEEE